MSNTVESMDKLVAMQVFITTVACGSQSGAAQKLGLSRPVVSRYLGELEDWAGARLLHRTTRRLSLTDAGTEALARCCQLLEMAKGIQAAVGEPSGVPRGRLRITASTTLGRSVLTNMIAQFLEIYPGVGVDMLLSDQTVSLVDERIDLAIRITNILDSNVVARKLAQCRVMLCASPAYLRRHATPRRVEELGSHNCLIHSFYGKGTWTFNCNGEELAVPVTGNFGANDASAIEQAVLHGAGLAMLPAYMALPLIDKGELVALLPECEAIPLNIYAIYATRKNMPLALSKLIEFLGISFKDARLG
ncbi:LysR family transcriptional regulator [Janthinobacterium sp. RB2R34]